MKTILFTLLLLAFNLLLISAGTVFTIKADTYHVVDKPDALGCAPSGNDIAADSKGKFITVLPGLGNHSRTISTKNDSTQIYFDQGLNFYFSYHFREALASFKEATRFDPDCAITYWGQALAQGPYYNDYYYKMKKEVPDAIKRMTALEAVANLTEKGLIHAMQRRYSEDLTNADRPRLDSNYASALYNLSKQYKDDNDIKALYIDAVMLQHKWDFWSNDGNPKPWTTELVKGCEEIIKNDPGHPAALHYYIHLTEASRHPGLALHSADVLKDAMPGVGHMVHMATHMYQRNGLYAKGVSVNEDANNVNNKVDSLSPNLGIGKNSLLHIYAVQSFCAINAGMYKNGMPVYLRARNRVLDLRTSIDKDPYSQFVYMMPVLAWVRLGKWQEILQAPLPDAGWKYASVIDNYAKGLAYIKAKNLKAAKQCLVNIESNLKDSLLAVRLMPFNEPVKSCKIAAAILKGALLYEEGKSGESVTAFKNAIAEEDKLVYREPQDWIIPARQYMGAYLLKMHKALEAEKIYKEDLIANPENGWSLLGMYNSLSAQHKISGAAKFKARYMIAFKSADVKPVASVF